MSRPHPAFVYLSYVTTTMKNLINTQQSKIQTCLRRANHSP